MQVTVLSNTTMARDGPQGPIEPTLRDAKDGRADFGKVFRQATQAEDTVEDVDQDGMSPQNAAAETETRADKDAPDGRSALPDAQLTTGSDENSDRLPETSEHATDVTTKVDHASDPAMTNSPPDTPARKAGTSINETVASAFMIRDQATPVARVQDRMPTASIDAPVPRTDQISSGAKGAVATQPSSDRAVEQPMDHRNIVAASVASNRSTDQDAPRQPRLNDATVPRQRDKPVHPSRDTGAEPAASFTGRAEQGPAPQTPAQRRTDSAASTGDRNYSVTAQIGATPIPTAETQGRKVGSIVLNGTNTASLPKLQQASGNPQHHEQPAIPVTQNVTGRAPVDRSISGLGTDEAGHPKTASGRSSPPTEDQLQTPILPSANRQSNRPDLAPTQVASSNLSAQTGQRANAATPESVTGQVAINVPLTDSREDHYSPRLERRTRAQPQIDVPTRNMNNAAISAPVAPVAIHTAEGAGRADIAMIEDVVWDLRPLNAPAATPTQIMQARPEMPPHIVQQLAQALHRSPDRPLEIALNPAELGRVRMTLTATDAGITVNILADRPDTLDLMRRNIDDLGQSFAELGYEDIAFAFGQNGDPSDMDDDPHSDDPHTLVLDLETLDDNAENTPNAPRLAIVAEGVDIRL